MRSAAFACLFSISCSVDPSGAPSRGVPPQDFDPAVFQTEAVPSASVFSKYSNSGVRRSIVRHEDDTLARERRAASNVGLGQLGLTLAHGTINPAFCDTLTFQRDAFGAPIAAGADLAAAYADAGISIAAFGRDAPYPPGLAIAFDSSQPTGDDCDLGTPNQQYGGPGIGAGGATNDRALGNLLIKAENTCDADGDGLIDDPDDDAGGAWVEFAFAEEKCVARADIVDIEDAERPARFRLYDDQDQFLSEVEAGGLGDNSVERVLLDTCGVHKLKVGFQASGALHDVTVCNVPEPVTQANFDLDLNNIVLLEFDLQIDLISGTQQIRIADSRNSLDPARLITGGALSNFTVMNAAVPAGTYDHLHVEMRNFEAVASDGSRIALPDMIVQQIAHSFEVRDCGATDLVADWSIDARIEGDLLGLGIGVSFGNVAGRQDTAGCPP